jgi:hypothetical protein
LADPSDVELFPKLSNSAFALSKAASFAPRLAVRCALTLRFFSPGPHKWQNWQASLFSQPVVWKNEHGLQSPLWCNKDPMLGDVNVPNSGANKESANLNTAGVCGASLNGGGGGGGGGGIGDCVILDASMAGGLLGGNGKNCGCWSCCH